MKNRINHSKRGIAMPMVLAFFLLFFILGTYMVKRFSQMGKREFMKNSISTKNYFLAQSGIERAVYELKKPQGGTPHTWSENSNINPLVLQNGDETITVTIEDVLLEGE